MKDKIILILKGFIVGIGKIIPGVSGAMLAISLGIYDKCIYAISNFTKSIKDNIFFLFYVGIGICISIGIFSNLVIYLLDKYYFITMCFFIGLIVGGIPNLYNESKIDVKKKKNIIIISISFLIILSLNYINPNHIVKMNANFFVLILIGFLEAFAMVVPGISGTILLMLIGYYDLVIMKFSQILNIANIFASIQFFLPFGIGLVIGVLIFSKIIEYCLKKYNSVTYSIIFGFILSSIFIIVLDITKISMNFFNILIGIIFIIIGYYIAYILDSKLSK